MRRGRNYLPAGFKAQEACPKQEVRIIRDGKGGKLEQANSLDYQGSIHQGVGEKDPGIAESPP